MDVKRLVVKVGTSTLTHKTGFLNLERIEKLARVLSDIKNSGIDVVLVSSGAIGVGMSKLGLLKKPTELKMKQAVAAVGQVELMDIYGRLFADYGVTVAQILLTKNVLDDELRCKNAENTMESLFNLGVIPIVNENDTISTEQIEFGDNDTLSAYVATVVHADAVVILSDIDGLYDKDPHKFKDAKLLNYIYEINEDVKNLAGGAGSKVGTGGMITKILAAEIAMKNNIITVIANGKDPKILYKILNDKAKCTILQRDVASTW